MVCLLIILMTPYILIYNHTRSDNRALQYLHGGSFEVTLTVPLMICVYQAELYDAGTDNGFTFTSPNWPTEPQGVVFK